MQVASITKKLKLDGVGIRNRQHFLSAYEHELTKVRTAISVKTSYRSMMQSVLGSSAYIFVSVNLSSADIRKAIEAAMKRNGGILPAKFMPLGLAFYEAIRSGASVQDAAESMWNKFLIRLNQKVLGAKYKRFGHSLRWIRVHENDTKRFSMEPTNHIHMLVQIPSTRLSPKYYELKFKNIFRKLFSKFVFARNCISRNCAVLNLRRGRMSGNNPHPKYIMKQLVNWETASDRVFTSGAPKTQIQ